MLCSKFGALIDGMFVALMYIFININFSSIPSRGFTSHEIFCFFLVALINLNERQTSDVFYSKVSFNISLLPVVFIGFY